MQIALSKVTNQGQISIPAEVRKDLAIRPGTELVWDRQENGEYVIRPKRYTLKDLHQILADEPKIHLGDDEIRQARREFLAHFQEGRAQKKPRKKHGRN